jgi:hypothetical protein
MTGIEFLMTMIAEFHSALMEDVKTLTPQNLKWKPAPQANPIGFLFWHYMRTEDNLVAGLQGKPTIWEAEKWYEKMGLDAKAQGTGFKEPDVDKIAVLPLADLMAYADGVSRNTQEYLKTLDDAKLDFAPDPSRPRRTIGAVLRSFLLAHGWWHLGEIKYIKGLQGMPGAR